MKINLFALAAGAVLIGAGNIASAMYSTGFEPPDYVAGSGIGGVDGWVNGSGSGATQTVSNSFSYAGSQSLDWDNTVTNGFYSVRRALDPYSDLLTVGIKLWVTGNTGADRLYGIYFVSTATSTLGGTTLGVTIGGDGTVRGGTTWASTYSGTGLGTAAAGTFADRWLDVSLTYDPNTLDGTVNIGGFGGGQGDIGGAFTVTGSVLGLNLGSDYNTTANRLGAAYMDDLSIEVVPEPASMIALGLGAAALIARKRRKTA